MQESTQRINKELNSLTAAYEAACSDAIVLKHDTPDIVRLTGADRLDLLHRISTNHLSELNPGELKSTILTTANARVLDVIRVLHRENDSLLIANPDHGIKVQGWLDRHIFFQDDVQTEWVETEDYHLWGAYGPESNEFALSVFPWLAPLREGEYQVNNDHYALPSPLGRLDGLHLLVPNRELPDPTWDEIEQQVRREAYQAHRIEAGQPEIGREITDERIPLEIGLAGYIDFQKGCYIGQEIIARMDSRNQIARMMIGIRMTSEIPGGTSIYQNDIEIGQLTSSAYSPRFGYIGLGIVKTKGLDHTAPIHVGAQGGSLTSLPFA